MKMKVKIGRLFGMKVYLHSTFAIFVAYYLCVLLLVALLVVAACWIEFDMTRKDDRALCTS